MDMFIDSGSFDGLRKLADSLDRRLGVDQRKVILAGNEKLTLSTKQPDWQEWVGQVESRLQHLVGSDTARAVLRDLSVALPPDHPLCSGN